MNTPYDKELEEMREELIKAMLIVDPNPPEGYASDLWDKQIDYALSRAFTLGRKSMKEEAKDSIVANCFDGDTDGEAIMIRGSEILKALDEIKT